MKSLNRPTLERLFHYYHFINEFLENHGAPAFSSTSLAKLMDIDDTQVRKDFAAIGLKGRPRVGFNLVEVKSKIREILGFNENYKAVIVGAGHLGGAIASNKEFVDYGMSIVALFDIDPQKVGLTVGSNVIQPISRLKSIIKQRNVKLGILTVPAEGAQKMADRLISSGVTTIWNFSPANLIVAKDIVVRHEHISVGLAELSYHLRKSAKKTR